MKDLFPGYYRPTPEEFDDLWKKATFVFDANVLLHIHRRNKQTRRAILDTLKRLGERLWIPYEIAAEYQRNKLKVAYSLVDGCKTILDGLGKLKDQLGARELREHPFLDTDALARGLDQLAEQVAQSREKSRSISLDDAESIELATLLRGRLDEPYSEEVRSNKLKEAKARAEKKIPPGYKDFDSKSDEARAGGDALIWFKIVERAKGNQCPVILVTDDQKEDWWWTHQGLTHGPRPELGQEMWSLAQQRFYMYTLSAFLELAGKYLGQNVPAEVVEEVKEREQEQEQTTRADWLMADARRVHNMYTALSATKRQLESVKEALHERISALEEKLGTEPYGPDALDDRRTLEHLEEALRFCESDLARTTRERLAMHAALLDLQKPPF